MADILFGTNASGPDANQSAAIALLTPVLGTIVSKPAVSITAADVTAARGVIVGRSVEASEVAGNSALNGPSGCGKPLLSLDSYHFAASRFGTGRGTVNNASNLYVRDEGAAAFGLTKGSARVFDPSGQLTFVVGIPGAAERLTQTFSVSTDYLHFVIPAGTTLVGGSAATAPVGFAFWPSDGHLAPRTAVLEQMLQQMALDMFGTATSGGGGGTTAPAPTVSIVGGTLTLEPWEQFTVQATSNQASVTFAVQSGDAPRVISTAPLSVTYESPGSASGSATVIRATATNADGVAATATVQVNTRPSSLVAWTPNGAVAQKLVIPSQVTYPAPATFTLGVTEPTPENTWLGMVTTQTIAGDFTPTSNTVYERVKFLGRVLTNSTMTGVVFRHCHFAGSGGRSSDSALVNNELATSEIRYEHCLFKPDTPSQYWHSIRGKNFTAYRCRFEHVVDGPNVNVGGTVNVKVQGCYVGDLSYFSPCSYQGDNRTHNDGSFIFGGTGIEIRGNRLSANASSTVGDGGSTTVPAPNPYHPSVTGQGLGCSPSASVASPPANVTVADNWFSHGAQSITVVAGSGGIGSGWSVTGNRFDTRTNPSIAGERRGVYIASGLSVPGLPATTGPDTTSGNVDWDGSQIIIHRELS